jgi:hypothetical protein
VLGDKQGTFKHAEEKIESCDRHFVVWSRPLKTWCLIVAIAFHINVIILLLLRHNTKIAHGQTLMLTSIFRR